MESLNRRRSPALLFRVAAVLALAGVLAGCINPAGTDETSGQDDDAVDLPDGDNSSYTPVGNTPQAGSDGHLSIDTDSSTITVTFDPGTDVETASSDLEYALYISSQSVVSLNEDLWYYGNTAGVRASAWSAYPTGYTFNRPPFPVYLNVGVRDGDGNVTAYAAEYVTPDPWEADYTVHGSYTGSASLNISEVDGDIVYVIANTNTGTSDDVTALTSEHFSIKPSPYSHVIPSALAPPGDAGSVRGIGIRGFPGQHDTVAPLVSGDTKPSDVASSSVVVPTSVGDTDTFALAPDDRLGRDSISAQVVAVGATGDWTVSVWLDTNDTSDVTAAAVDELTQRFMAPGDDNDIFDWVSAVYGSPWGEHPFGNVLSSDRRDIHILLYDIDADGVPNDGGARTVGYFYSRDNYSDIDSSNKRLMFYMDSALFGASDGAGWQITDYWPSEVVSTLAHEFQHMIHFYQRSIVQNVVPTRWVNEMASMIAEDLLSRDVGVDGPRGVDHTQGSAGGSGLNLGRIPGWTTSPHVQLDEWQNTLSHYSVKYAFGATVLRLYGAEVFSHLMDQSSLGRDAVTAAVNATGESFDFSDLLQRWSVAMLVSGDTLIDTTYRVNTGTWIPVAASGVSFDVGSINYHNYTPSFPIESVGSYPDPLPPATVAYVRAAENVSGSHTDELNLPPGIVLTVVEER